MRDTDDSRTTAEAMTAGVAGLELSGRGVLVASDSAVLSQTAALQISPQRDHFKPLIEINRNIAAGLGGRA